MQQHEQLLDAPINDINNTPIYSSVAVGLFTFFFTPLFGMILAYQNLKSVGKANLGLKVVLASIVAFTGLIVVEIFYIELPGVVNMGVSIGFALLLGRNLHDTYIPNHKQMPKKKIWVPLVIGIVLLVIMVVVTINTLGLISLY